MTWFANSRIGRAYKAFFLSNPTSYRREWKRLVSLALLQLIQRVANIAPILLGVALLQEAADGLPIFVFGLTLSVPEITVGFVASMSFLALISWWLSARIQRLTTLLEQKTAGNRGTKKERAAFVAATDFSYFVVTLVLVLVASPAAPAALLASGVATLVALELRAKHTTKDEYRVSTQIHQIIGFGAFVVALAAIAIMSGRHDVSGFLLAAVLGRFSIGRLIRGHQRVVRYHP